MIEIALIGGAVIGLRCRAELILAGVAAIFVAGVAEQVAAAEPPLLAVVFAFLGAAVAQVAAIVVHVLKEGLEGALSVRA